ncbi:Sorting and assembly machinery component 50-like protein [Sciurus carolinensis]|uniref:Sorting and assembly machinery component 50-like protein n=1 Tax=Sciurus carolinensis TaxID=30640 RepID=A0AA41NE40_SCICA|nr:Sorting and assembly machinery component 50-like protein [Sciurus carolinensis]
MGTVHSRSLEPLPSNGPDFGALGVEAKFVEVEPEAKQEILENKDMIVQHVHFDCLGRSRDGINMCETGDVFKARNLIEVMRMTQEDREKLLCLGIFRQMDILIDTCQGDDALLNGLDITFEVTVKETDGQVQHHSPEHRGQHEVFLKVKSEIEEELKSLDKEISEAFSTDFNHHTSPVFSPANPESSVEDCLARFGEGVLQKLREPPHKALQMLLSQ